MNRSRLGKVSILFHMKAVYRAMRSKGIRTVFVRMSNGTAGIFAQRLPAIPEKHIYHVYIYRPISKDADSSAKIEIKYDG